jgi:magnesium chelatase subunit I
MHVYPFTAIVGQEEMKLALLLAVIEPQIGGVLILGHRGTGKSTAVRALAELLPPIRRVKGCLFGCDPAAPGEWCEQCRKRSRGGSRRLPAESAPVRVVELPLGATEDRVCGTLDIERALRAGRKVFEPGLLARAHRGFLYIDEVNLLEDHLVDLLLDVAASGRNVVEREGVSVTHPARFVLVGSGNPEEGDLRPQLLDRFGLNVRAETILDIAARVEIVRRREQFERDPAGFARAMEAQQECLRQRLIRARELLPQVRLDEELLLAVAELCLKLRADGHRGELTLIRAARALAAFEGRERATGEDVRRLAVMALRHRLTSEPRDGVDAAVRIERAMNSVFGVHVVEGAHAFGRSRS